MQTTRPILIVEDDEEEQELLKHVLNNLPFNCNFLFVNDGEEALHYLRTTTIIPQLIISDVNMPGMSGLELKSYINDDRQLCDLMIPFVFLSGAAISFTVTLAYKLNVQGFFVKQVDAVDMQADISRIIDYWYHCQLPDRLPSG